MTDTELAHYGVKGMKWGVTREGPSRSERRAERKAKKKADWDEHDKNVMGARQRQADRVKEMDKLAAKTYSATSELGRLKAEAAYNKLANETMNGLDAQAAQVLTRGERQVNGALLSVGLVALAASAALTIAGK